MAYTYDQINTHLKSLYDLHSSLSENASLTRTQVIQQVMRKIPKLPLPFSLQPHEIGTLDTETDEVVLEDLSKHQVEYEEMGYVPHKVMQDGTKDKKAKDGQKSGLDHCSEVAVTIGNGDILHLRISPPPGWKISSMKMSWNGHTEETFRDPRYGPIERIEQVRQKVSQKLKGLKVLILFGGGDSDLTRLGIDPKSFDNLYYASSDPLILELAGSRGESGYFSNAEVGLANVVCDFFGDVMQEMPERKYIIQGRLTPRTILPHLRPCPTGISLRLGGHCCPVDSLYHWVIGATGLILRGLTHSLDIGPLSLLSYDSCHPLLKLLKDKPVIYNPGKRYMDLRSASPLIGPSILIYGVSSHLAANAILSVLEEEVTRRFTIRSKLLGLWAKGRLQVWKYQPHPKVHRLWDLGSSCSPDPMDSPIAADLIDSLYSFLSNVDNLCDLFNQGHLVSTTPLVSLIPHGQINPSDSGIFQDLLERMNTSPISTYIDSIPYNTDFDPSDIIAHPSDSSISQPHSFADTPFPISSAPMLPPKFFLTLTRNRVKETDKPHDVFILFPLDDQKRIMSPYQRIGIWWDVGPQARRSFASPTLEQHLGFNTPKTSSRLQPVNYTIPITSLGGNTRKAPVTHHTAPPVAYRWIPLPIGINLPWISTLGQQHWKDNMFLINIPDIGLRGVVQGFGMSSWSRASPFPAVRPPPVFTEFSGLIPYTKILPFPFYNVEWWAFFRAHGRSYHEPEEGDFQPQNCSFIFNLTMHYGELLQRMIDALAIEVELGLKGVIHEAEEWNRCNALLKVFRKRKMDVKPASEPSFLSADSCPVMIPIFDPLMTGLTSIEPIDIPLPPSPSSAESPLSVSSDDAECT